MKEFKITPEVVEEAKKIKNGWVYAIDGKFTSSQTVPPYAIAGAWKVDEKGDLTGEFRPNPKYVPSSE